jgi:phytoene dehydrogenase-like protein
VSSANRQQSPSALGWPDRRLAPDREGGNPLVVTPRTAIDGLWLASAYVFGGGFTGAMIGGATAARDAIRMADRRLKLPALGALS